MAFWGKSLYFLSSFFWELEPARFKGLDWVILHDRSYRPYTIDTITDTVSFQVNISFFSIRQWRAQKRKSIGLLPICTLSFICAYTIYTHTLRNISTCLTGAQL